MKTKMSLLLLAVALLVVGVGVFIVTRNSDNSQSNVSESKIEYTSISSDDLKLMLEDKDFVFIDVHTPEQEHIPGTDFIIPYDEVDKIESVLQDKDTKVVLYCRSGSMSKTVAQELADREYTNVYELVGGLHDWKSTGREVNPQGSVPVL